MSTTRSALAWVRRHGATLRLALAAVLLAATLGAPQWTLPRPRFEHVVVLDITQSMSVPDVRIDGRSATRIALAQRALRDALLALPCGSTLGLAVFTENRVFLLFAPVEVCAHLDELRRSIALVDARMAWMGNSEIAKGLRNALQVAATLPGTPSVVFVTDGHEAPPLSARFGPPPFERRDGPGGVIVGVGGLRPVPIPKRDPWGRPLGEWRADEVLQTDIRSLGLGNPIAEDGTPDSAAAFPTGATPGSEHLSSLREGYLRALADLAGLRYARLDETQALARVLTDPALARAVPVPTDLRPGLGALAALLLLAPHLRGVWRRRR